jgi:CRP-like cAMP-binding protein
MSIVTSGLLAEIPLFSTMDEEERGELRSLMTERLFPPGQMVMKAGEPGGTSHVIEQGEVELWLTDTRGEKMILDEHDNLGRSTREKKGRQNHGDKCRRHLLSGRGSRTYQAHTRDKENQCHRRGSRVCAHE